MTVSRGDWYGRLQLGPAEDTAHGETQSMSDTSYCSPWKKPCLLRAAGIYSPHVLRPAITTSPQLVPQPVSSDRKIPGTCYHFLSAFNLSPITQGHTVHFLPPLGLRHEIHLHIFIVGKKPNWKKIKRRNQTEPKQKQSWTRLKAFGSQPKCRIAIASSLDISDTWHLDPSAVPQPHPRL